MNDESVKAFEAWFADFHKGLPKSSEMRKNSLQEAFRAGVEWERSRGNDYNAGLEAAAQSVCYGCGAQIPYKEGAHEPTDGSKWFECKAEEIRALKREG